MSDWMTSTIFCTDLKSLNTSIIPLMRFRKYTFTFGQMHTKNGSSALAKQQYHDGDDQLRHGSDSIRGYIDSLDFEINHQKIKWFYNRGT